MSTSITIIGNITRDPELSFSNDGLAYIRFGVADTYKDKSGTESTSFYDVVAFDSVATNIAESLMKGSRVVIVGRLSLKDFERKDGTKGTAGEIVADTVAADLRWATAKITRNEKKESAMSSSSSSKGFDNF